MTRAANRAAKEAAAKALASEIAQETIDLSNKDAFHAVRVLWAERWPHRIHWKLGMRLIWACRMRLQFARDTSP